MATVDSNIALVSLDDVKNLLNMRGSDKDRDLINLINRVSGDCSAYCNRVFLSATYTEERYDGTGQDELVLKHYPVTAVSEIIPYKDGDALTVEDDYVIYDADSGIIKLVDGKTFPVSTLQIKVTYTAGYAFASLPYDLVQSVLEAVAHRWKEQDTGRYGVDSVQMDEQQTNYITEQYNRHVLAVWDRYRARNIA